MTLVGLLSAGIAWMYLHEVWEGIRIHKPLCAPIGDTTVRLVFAFTTVGAVGCAAATILCRRRNRWAGVGILALVLNAAALLTWGYWITTDMLLPYDQFCDKVGMP